MAMSLASAFADAPLARSTPEDEGISTQAILRYVQAVDKIDTLHSFMIVRHGKVIAEGWWKPESAEKPHILWSLSKSFTSTAIGLLIEDGKLKLDDPVLKFFPDEAPENPSENLEKMTVRHLLTMSCGHETESPRDDAGPSVKAFLAHPVPHKPGTHFQYNTPGTYMLSAILTRVTGKTVLEYLNPRLFEPMGIEDPVWDHSGEGYSLGGYGLYLRTEDIAKFGQLYLQKGKWQGRQLIPEEWVAKASSKQIENSKSGHAKIGNDWAQGYGFQFWKSQHGAYRGDGRDGQLCVIMPEQDMVIAVTAKTGAMQEELDAIWENLLPAVKSDALPEDPAAAEDLREAVSDLTAHPKD